MKTLQEILDDSVSTGGSAVTASFGREDWRLDAERFREFWRNTRMYAVSTVSAKGDPHIAPVHVLLQDDDTLQMAIFEDSVRLKDLRRNPKLAITSWNDDGKVAIVYGTCSEIPDSRRTTNPNAAAGTERYIIMMKIEITRAYAMAPKRSS